jgi:hypothetical protein
MKKAVTFFLSLVVFVLTACQDGGVPATESSNYADSLRAELAGQATPTPVKSEAQSPTPISAPLQNIQLAQFVSTYSGQCDLGNLGACSLIELAPLVAACFGTLLVLRYPFIAGAKGKK